MFQPLSTADFAALGDGSAVFHHGHASLMVQAVSSPHGGFEARFVMRGRSGVHSLLCAATDLARLNAHWAAFATHPKNAPQDAVPNTSVPA